MKLSEWREVYRLAKQMRAQRMNQPQITSAEAQRQFNRVNTPPRPMNANEKRIRIVRIAELCGVQCCCGEIGMLCGLHEGGALPDYLNDLNAMHEAEKTLTGNELTVYDNVLFRLCGNVVRDMKFATAAQRAEAFLRAKS
jgi:hypothetical protein